MQLAFQKLNWVLGRLKLKTSQLVAIRVVYRHAFRGSHVYQMVHNCIQICFERLRACQPVVSSVFWNYTPHENLA